jgi:diadenosine tetraphosphate (Ap4A) HIT family hydrolase
MESPSVLQHSIEMESLFVRPQQTSSEYLTVVLALQKKLGDNIGVEETEILQSGALGSQRVHDLHLHSYTVHQ